MRLIVASSPPSDEVQGVRVTKDDVLFGYRLQLFSLAADRGASQACRLMGVHRSTYYRWKAQVDRQGLEMLRPRERRRPDAQPALADRRAAHRGVRAWSSRAGSEADRGALGAPRVGRPADLARRGLQDAVSSWPEHARQALGARRRLPRAVRAAPRPSASAARRQRAPRRARRDRLLLRGPAARHKGPVWQITRMAPHRCHDRAAPTSLPRECGAPASPSGRHAPHRLDNDGTRSPPTARGHAARANSVDAATRAAAAGRVPQSMQSDSRDPVGTPSPSA